MKKVIFYLALIILYSQVGFTQSTERFIRITGNSSYEFKANGYRVYFNIAEILPNSYNKEDYKSIEANIAETFARFKSWGIKDSEIYPNYKSKNSNNYNSKSESYYVDVVQGELVNKINSIKNSGFKVESTKFLFANIDPNIEIALSKEAINDATRKAKSVTKEIGMKVGKILNIEDKSTNCCTDFGETDQAIITKKYTLNVTFELLD